MVGYLIVGVIAAIVIAIALYFLLRFLRGSIKMYLMNTSVNSGDVIKGNFELHTKKEIQGNRLVVELIGSKVTKHRKDNGETETRTHEIYRHGVTIENQKLYPAGFKEKYDFKLPTPNSNTSDSMNSELGEALTAALSFVSDRQTYVKWKVEARLDAEGVDLVDTEKVNINGFN
jgi:hypothetical protein